MSNEGYMNSLVMLMNAINTVVTDDLAKMSNPRKRKDDETSWHTAAYYFGRIVGTSVDWKDVRKLYYDTL